MGLKPAEVNVLTLREFAQMQAGYLRREEKITNLARNLMATVINFGGLGTKTPVTATQIWPLNLDKEGQKRMITTLQQAMELLKEFKRCQD